MAYFLKKSKQKNRTYIAIYESFYDPAKKGTAHRCHKSLGSIETLKEKGIEDPIAHYQKVVDELNKNRKEESVKKISTKSPLIHLGYFPLKSIMEKLNIKHFIDYFKLITRFEFDLYDLLSSLIYARSVNPCSKYRTFHEVLPNLYQTYNFSYDQLLDGLAFLGNNYEKIVEIFTTQVDKIYKLDTTKTYFDCTNFYFEIDREDDLKKNGVSKENQRKPLVGLGLLLDRNQIPVGMKIYPGNESEKPIIRDVISNLKKQNNITGRTIHVADKGLNCANNIAYAKKNGDGYIFSKAVKKLPDKEKKWVLLDRDFKDVKDKNGNILFRYKTCIDKFPYDVTYEGKVYTIEFTEKRLLTYNPSLAYKKRCEINKMVEKAKFLTHSQAKKAEYGESAKYVKFVDEKGNKAAAVINNDAINEDLELAGYNLLVTSEIKMNDLDIYETYHNLWRIEESFKIMKSDLDARPVFLQKVDSIKGHFLICYCAVLLERLLQFKVLENKFSTSEIYKFIKKFNLTDVDNRFINLTTSSELIDELTIKFDLPLTNYFLSKSQVNSILNYKL